MKKFRKIMMAVCLAFAVVIAVPSVVPQMSGTITAEAASQVKISKTKATLIKGETLQLKISGTSKKATWSSSSAKVAKVSASGKVTAVGKGTVTITAKIGTKKYTCKVTVETPSISKTSLRLAKDSSYTLKVNGTSRAVTWSTSSKTVAAVSSSGRVTAKKNGTATITAKIGSKKYTCKITVESPSLSKTSLTMMKGKTYILKLNDTKQTVTWSTSDKNTATVSSSGKITAKKTGTVTITAKVVNKSYTCKVKILSKEAYNLQKIKDYVKKNGEKDEYGDFTIAENYQLDDDYNSLAMITYEADTKKLIFSTINEVGDEAETIVSMYAETDKTSIVSPEYCILYVTDEDVISAAVAAASFKASTYKINDQIDFEVEAVEGIADDDIRELANNELMIAFTEWEDMLERNLGLSLKDIGFNSLNLEDLA